MCLECFGKHRGLDVHISFVQSITMDSWFEIHIKKMEAGGNEKLNAFLYQYEIPKETDIVTKYNINAASVYGNWIQAIAEDRPWRDPPVVKENLGGSSWDNDDGFRSSSDIRQNQSTGNVRGVSGGGVGATGGMPARSKSNRDIYTRSQLETSAANTESFFSRKMQENDSQPEGLPPSQGGKYVGFGSAPAPSQRNTNAQGDVFSVVSQVGMFIISATAVQVGTKEITSKYLSDFYQKIQSWILYLRFRSFANINSHFGNSFLTFKISRGYVGMIVSVSNNCDTTGGDKFISLLCVCCFFLSFSEKFWGF
ncbi:hypothetical protein UlMin_025566 [Ulmus minor]